MLVAWYPLNGNLKDISGNHYDLNTNHIYGDINGDGRITQEDSELALQYFNGITTLTSEQTIRADVNQDGNITENDAERILRYINNTSTDPGIIGSPVLDQIRYNPVWGEGKTGKAWVNNSHNCSTNIVMINKLKGATEFSLSYWIKVDAILDNFRDILSFYTINSQDNSKKALRLESRSYSGNHLAGNRLAWYNNNHLGTDLPVIDHAVNLGEWIHFTFVFGKEQAYKYVNGKYIGTNKYTLSQLDVDKIFLTGEFKLGNDLGESLYFDGSICNIKIYDHCLSKEEAYQDYLSPMLHYTFEQPYAEETENMPHSFGTYQVDSNMVLLQSDPKGKYFTKTSSDPWNHGPGLWDNIVYGGNYYTWSLEVNPDVDILEIASDQGHFDRNINPTSTWVGNEGATIIDVYSGSIPKNTWTRVWITCYIEPEIGKATFWPKFCPVLPTGVTSMKIYCRNSQLEKKDHMTPYTRNIREGQVIRDKSGMGNDGVVKYKREEIPIIQQLVGNAGSNDTLSYDSNTNTWTFNPKNANNYTYTLGKMNYNSRYHYKDSIISYEFDLELKNITKGSDSMLCVQGTTVFKDNTFIWQDSPVFAINLETNHPSGGDFDLTTRVRNLTNGVYHITLQHKINPTAREGASSVGSNVSYYELGLRFDYVKGTVIMKNLHAYYQDLDTSTLGITDRNNVIGTHSAHFNGKTRIETSVLKNREIEQITYSAWFYPSQDDVKLRYRNLFAQHETSTYVSDLWISYDTENAGLWAHIYGNDNRYHYFTCGSTGIVKPESWNHIVYTFDKGVSKFYLNGERLSTQDNSSTFTKIKCRDQVSYIGQGSGGQQDWHSLLEGYLDDMRLYPIPLTDEEVKALYHTKAKIDKDSNMYTNQLVETKNESVFELRGDLYISLYGGKGTYSITFKDKIFTLEIQNPEASNGIMGFYIRYYSFNDNIISGKHYRYSLYVKLPKSGSWVIGHERLRFYYDEYEANKWYHVVYDGIASNNNLRAFCFYHREPSSSTNKIESGDKIQIRDFEFYRIDDDLFPIERDTDPKVTKKAQIKGFEVNEIDYDRLTKRQNIVEKDGAKWVEVFYHNTNNNTEWFADEAEALHCTSEYKYSRLDCLEQYRQSDGKFEFLLEYPTENPGRYNRWKQTDNPAETVDTRTDIQYDDIPVVNGYEPIHIDWLTKGDKFGGLILSINDDSLIDGSIGNNWHFAIGVNKGYNLDGKLGIPGPIFNNNSEVYDNPNYLIQEDTHLYVRIDNINNRQQIAKLLKTGNIKTKEIKEV